MKTFIVIFIVLAIWAGLFGLFKKAGRKGWEALVPGYNLYTWLKITHKPWWWLILLIFPGVNILMLMVMCVNLSTVFGNREMKHVIAAAFFPFFYLPYLAFTKDIEYTGPIDRKKYPKSTTLEWRDAIIFAIVAASLIRTYFMEAFTIPTSSMEKSLLVGDYLFVSKMSYGPKVPQTPLAFPFAHHTLPFTDNIKSYLEWIELPYFRLPGFGKVERNDVVVFNFPAGDTVVVERQSEAYGQIKREVAFQLEQRDLTTKKEPQSDQYYLNAAREQIHRNYEVITRPVDKRENYIKRCVGIPGDKLEVRRGILYINDGMAHIPPKFQYDYFVHTKEILNRNRLKDNLGVSFADQNQVKGAEGYQVPLTLENYNKVQEFPQVKGVLPAVKFDQLKNTSHWVIPFFIQTDPMFYSKYRGATNRTFPNHNSYNWSRDNFGPITIPAKGATVELTPENLPLYKKVIGVYEGNDLEVSEDGQITINGETADSYTFKMDYYFMMGDNRHNSLDSRFWGFVPEDHIVGEGSFIWLSLDKEKGLFDGKIRWSRLFNIID